MLLLLLCAQIVKDAASVPVPCKGVRFAAASTTGAFLVVAEDVALHVLDGATLKPVRKLEVAATAVGFDETDGTLTTVGELWLRFDTRTWKETSRQDLPGADLKRMIGAVPKPPAKSFQPGQALATPDGAVYYRSKDGHLSKAVLEDGELKAEVLTRLREDVRPVERVLRASGDVVLVDGGLTCVALRGRQYALTASVRPLAAAWMGGRLALVMKDADGLYDPRTWKVTWTREAENVAAAFDLQRGRVFCAGKDAIRFWTAEKPDDVGFLQGRYRALAIDGASRSLYGIDSKTVRSWTLKE